MISALAASGDTMADDILSAWEDKRLLIRHLYRRPLETLLATFGILIAVQQILKNVFGTQARPLTAPGWLDGELEFNDVVSISYIRIAIFVLALMFLCFFLYLMQRTRLGLEVRAVTQNPAMAASMGINPDHINMLTFGLGSGIAGIAGVGNVWGTLAGATMIGSLQKVVEFLNPSTLIFVACLAVFTLVVALASEGYGLGLVSTSFVKTLGKTLCLSLAALTTAACAATTGFPACKTCRGLAILRRIWFFWASALALGLGYLTVWVAIGGRGRLSCRWARRFQLGSAARHPAWPGVAELS